MFSGLQRADDDEYFFSIRVERGLSIRNLMEIQIKLINNIYGSYFIYWVSIYRSIFSKVFLRHTFLSLCNSYYFTDNNS